MKTLRLLVALAALILPLSAQCGGFGAADLRTTPQIAGASFDLVVAGNPGDSYLLALSAGVGPTVIPGFGTLCLDLAPGLLLPNFFSGFVPASGEQALTFAVPNDPGLIAGFVLYAQALTNGAGGVGLSRGLRLDFHVGDSYEALPSLGAPRALATGNLTGGNQVLVAGGGNGNITSPVGIASTELYSPVTRTLVPGPSMAVSRALHTGTTLLDGRVLLAGGVVGTTGTVSASCELYDPVTNTFSLAAPMNSVRAGHAATRLADGRVLVVGGNTTYAGGTAAIGNILNSALRTGEVYDPATNTWTPVQNLMQSRRLLPGLVTLDDGRAIAISGLSGATSFFGQAIPNWTSSCDYYDPQTNSFNPAPSLPGQTAAPGVARRPNGQVLVAGGVVPGLLSIPNASSQTWVLDFNAAWSTGPSLPAATALPGMATLADGRVLVIGGASGSLTAIGATDAVSSFDGTSITGLAPLPVARGAQTTVLLPDSTVFLAGGGDQTGTAIANCDLYCPLP